MSDETDWASVSPQSLTPEAQRVRELVLKNRVPLRDFVRGLNVSLRTRTATSRKGCRLIMSPANPSPGYLNRWIGW